MRTQPFRPRSSHAPIAALLLPALFACGGGGGGGGAVAPPPPPATCQPPTPTTLDLVGEWAYGNAAAVAAVSIAGSPGSQQVTHRVHLGSGGCVFLFEVDLATAAGVSSLRLLAPRAAGAGIDEICVPGGFVYDLAATTQRIHVAGGQGGYRIHDTTASPFPLVGGLAVGTADDAGLSGAPVSILLATLNGGPHALLGLASAAVAIVDLSDETMPAIVCEVPLSGIPQGLDVMTVGGATWLAAASSCGGVDFVPLDGLPSCPSPASIVNLCPVGATPVLDCFLGIAGCADAEVRDVRAFTAQGTTFAAVAVNCFGLRVFDLTPLGAQPPAPPTLTGCYARADRYWLSSIEIEGDRWAYLGYDESNWGRYQVIGYPCPMPASLLSCRVCPWETSCKGFPTEVNTQFSGLEVVDLADPSNPVRTSSFVGPHHAGVRRTVVVDGEYVHVAKYFKGWEVVRSQPPAPPALVTGGELDNDAGIPVHGVSWAEPTTYDPAVVQMATEHNVHLLDVSDPTRPRWFLDSTTGNPTGFSSNQNPNPKAQVVQSSELAGHVYTGSFAEDFDVFRVDDPEQVADVGDVSMPVACADAGAGALRHTSREPAARAQVGQPPRDVLFLGGSTAFAENCFKSTLATFDLTNPAAPVPLGDLLPAPDEVHVFGLGLSAANDLAFLPYLRNPCDYLDCPPGVWPPPLPCPASTEDFDQAGGLLIVDVTDPALPIQRGAITLPGQPWRVAVEGDLAFVAAMCGGLLVIDVSDPADPRLAASYDGFPSWVFDVDVARSPSGRLFVYLAVFDAGVHVYEFVDDDPNCGYPIATYPPPSQAAPARGVWMGPFEGQANAVWVGPGPKRHVFVAKREGLAILDLPDDDG